MIINYTEIIEGLKKEIRAELAKKKRTSEWVYNIDSTHKILLVKPKYRIEVFDYANAVKCSIHLVIDNNTYSLDSKGEFRKIITEANNAR